MGDMIDRDAVTAKIKQQADLWENGALACGFDDMLRLYLPQAIADIPAATVGEAVAKAVIDRAVERLQALPPYAGRPAWEAVLAEELNAALEPVTQPAPDADDNYPYDAIEQCERDLDGVEDEPVVNEKLRTMHREYLQAIAEGRLVTDAVSPTDARLRAAVAQLDAGAMPAALRTDLAAAFAAVRVWAMKEIVADSCVPKDNREPGCLSCDTLAFLEAMEDELAALREGGDNG